MDSLRILVVDDEKVALRTAEKMLSGMGCEVTCVESGEEGLKRFAREPFDLVLSDVRMPGMDGIEMIRRMKALDPVVVPIVMTVLKDQETAVRALESGVRYFLNKPFSKEQLKKDLEKAAQERRRLVETRMLIGRLVQDRTRLQRQVADQDVRLTRMERYLRHLLDAAPFAILSTDEEGKILTVNEAAVCMYGAPQEQLLGTPLDQLFPEPSGGGADGRTYHLRKSGERFPVLLHRRDIQDDRGETIAHLYIVVDLSERERLESQLLQASRFAMLGELAPRIAHEFKTPLQLISGYSELAQDALQKGREEAALGFLRKIAPAVEQMLELAQQLAHLGEPASPRWEQIDLRCALEGLIEQLKPLGLFKQCEISCEFPEGLPSIEGDPGQIEQLFRNLLVNAAQAMESSLQRTLCLRLEAIDDGQQIQVAVSDTGEGIPPEHIDRIFEPFFTTRAEGKGTGLGLPIVQGIVERHKGSIRVESQPGEGTTFHLTFPAVS